jgi:hypothetical protein
MAADDGERLRPGQGALLDQVIRVGLEARPRWAAHEVKARATGLDRWARFRPKAIEGNGNTF